MKPISNLVHHIHYLAMNILLVLNLQINICKQVKKIIYASAGGMHLGNLSIDVFLEVNNNKYLNIVSDSLCY